MNIMIDYISIKPWWEEINQGGHMFSEQCGLGWVKTVLDAENQELAELNSNKSIIRNSSRYSQRKSRTNLVTPLPAKASKDDQLSKDHTNAVELILCIWGGYFVRWKIKLWLKRTSCCRSKSTAHQQTSLGKSLSEANQLPSLTRSLLGANQEQKPEKSH